MTHRFHQLLRLPSLLAVAVVLMTPAAWSQNQNQYDADEPRSTRNEPGGQQYDSRDDNRSYNQQNYQGSRSTQGELRNERRDEQYIDRSQSGRIGSRDADRQDQTSADRRQEWREERYGDEPAGLGVMLDTSNGDIEVREVARNSPADRAGIRRGDQIIAINGQRVDSPQQLTQLVRQEQPGSEVDIRIRRDGQQETLTARLESLRQALDTMERGGDQWFDRSRFSPEEEFYSNSPPWSDDELMQHVDQLERQVEAMRRQIEDLRTMLDNDPSQQRFSQRDQQNSRFRD